MAASEFDPFQVLGVAPSATKEQIRAAYREQVARYHPDKHRGNPLAELASAKLVEINRAYEILSKDDAGRGGTGARPIEAPAPTLGMKLFRSLGLVMGLLFFLRFGLALGRQALMLIRAAVLGMLSIARLGPIFAIAVIMAIGMGASFLLRLRKGQR